MFLISEHKIYLCSENFSNDFINRHLLIHLLYIQKNQNQHSVYAFTRSAQVNPINVPVNSPYLQYSSENLVVSNTFPILW